MDQTESLRFFILTHFLAGYDDVNFFCLKRLFSFSLVNVAGPKKNTFIPLSIHFIIKAVFYLSLWTRDATIQDIFITILFIKL